MRVTQVAIGDMRKKSRPTDGRQTKLRRQMNEEVLTESVRIFRVDGEHNSVRERSHPLWHRLVDKPHNPSPALAFSCRLRSVLRETLEQAGGGGLETLHGVGGGWCVCVRRWMNNIEMGVREYVGVSGVRGSVIGRADADGTGEREEVRLLQARTWVDEARDAGVDAPSVQ